MLSRFSRGLSLTTSLSNERLADSTQTPAIGREFSGKQDDNRMTIKDKFGSIRVDGESIWTD